MADGSYRRFYSGRFGPEGDITPDFATKVQSGKGFTNQNTSPQKQEATGKDEAGNTYKNQKNADEIDSKNKFMKG